VAPKPSLGVPQGGSLTSPTSPIPGGRCPPSGSVNPQSREEPTDVKRTRKNPDGRCSRRMPIPGASPPTCCGASGTLRISVSRTGPGPPRWLRPRCCRTTLHHPRRTGHLFPAPHPPRTDRPRTARPPRTEHLRPPLRRGHPHRRRRPAHGPRSLPTRPGRGNGGLPPRTSPTRSRDVARPRWVSHPRQPFRPGANPKDRRLRLTRSPRKDENRSPSPERVPPRPDRSSRLWVNAWHAGWAGSCVVTGTTRPRQL